MTTSVQISQLLQMQAMNAIGLHESCAVGMSYVWVQQVSAITGVGI